MYYRNIEMDDDIVNNLSDQILALYYICIFIIAP